MRDKVLTTRNLPESLVVKLWQQLFDRADLTTEQGEPVRIIYPGRRNDDQGPDFRDAVIATRCGLVKGDIEIHVKSSRWRAHRHHQDPSYNRIILHVVMWHDAKEDINLQKGEKVPTLALHKYLKNSTRYYLNSAPPKPPARLPYCKAGERPKPPYIGEFLDSSGMERFSIKAAWFHAALARTEANQCLYQGIMGALGYAKNKLPFLELAHRVPLQVLNSITRDKTSDTEHLAYQQALLLGTAGLLPSQCSNWHLSDISGDERTAKLERLWASLHLNGTMSEQDWHFGKVRPNNSPVRRIAAMACLLLRYRKRGLLEEMIHMIQDVPIDTGCQELENALLVTTNAPRANHFISSWPSEPIMPTLLGRGRAADIAVNVLLPFTAAWGKLNSRPEITRKAYYFYCHYPRLAANALEQHMRHQLRLNSDVVDSAQRQQGLIHVYQTLCSQGKCSVCPLGRVK